MIFEGAKFMKLEVLYIKKNLRHSAITTSKDIKILQPGPEKRGVSKKPRTLNHPVGGKVIDSLIYRTVISMNPRYTILA